jgi:hypothetical protein
MYPNDPYSQPPTPSGIDYLNQIAAPPEPTGFDKKTKIIIIIIALVGVLSLGFIWAASQSGSGPTISNAIMRVARLQTVTELQKKRLKNSTVTDINSSLDAILTTAVNKATPIAQSEKLDINKALKVPDFEVKLSEKLDDAFLNDQLDAVYTREMAYQLELLSSELSSLSKKAKKSDVKEFLEKTQSDITSIKKRLESSPV